MRSTQLVSIRRKWNAVLTVFFFITTFLPVSTYAADNIVDYDYTQEITDLTKNYDSILDYTESKRCVAYSDQDKTLCTTYEDTVVYLFKTDTSAPPTVINKNIEQFNDNTYKIYSSDVYYQDEQTNTWKQTEYGVIEKNDFQAVQDYELKTVDEISFFNNPFKIYRVNAQSPIYSGVDSWSRHLCSACGWSTVRTANGTDGTASDELYIGWNDPDNQIYRSRITFDTSALDGTVSSSTLILTSFGTTGSMGNFNIYGENPASDTVYNASDYQNSDTTAKSDPQACAAQNSKYAFVLNASGLSDIDVSGYSSFSIKAVKDAENTYPGASNVANCQVYNSETTGTDKDPYLLVETGEEATTTPEEEATTTLSELPELPFIDDLTVITGRTDHYESSTTAADWSELHYYRVPAFLWWILTSTFLFILGFILSQIQRILRKKK